MRAGCAWFFGLLGLFLAFLGLFFFLNCMNFLYERALIEGALAFFAGLVVFKAGMLLVKLFLAARILVGGEPPPDLKRR